MRVHRCKGVGDCPLSLRVRSQGFDRLRANNISRVIGRGAGLHGGDDRLKLHVCVLKFRLPIGAELPELLGTHTHRLGALQLRDGGRRPGVENQRVQVLVAQARWQLQLHLRQAEVECHLANALLERREQLAANAMQVTGASDAVDAEAHLIFPTRSKVANRKGLDLALVVISPEDQARVVCCAEGGREVVCAAILQELDDLLLFIAGAARDLDKALRAQEARSGCPLVGFKERGRRGRGWEEEARGESP